MGLFKVNETRMKNCMYVIIYQWFRRSVSISNSYHSFTVCWRTQFVRFRNRCTPGIADNANEH